jgi:hypothetical protein
MVVNSKVLELLVLPTQWMVVCVNVIVLVLRLVEEAIRLRSTIMNVVLEDIVHLDMVIVTALLHIGATTILDTGLHLVVVHLLTSMALHLVVVTMIHTILVLPLLPVEDMIPNHLI